MPLPQRRGRLQSLRRRLLLLVCVAAFLVWGLAGVLSYLQARHEAEELMDGHLALSARLLLALVRNNESHLADLKDRLATVRGDSRGVYESPLEFQVGLRDGAILLRSEDAPKAPLLGAPGYFDIEREGQTWRLLNMTTPSGDYRVQVAQSMQLRERAALEVAGQTVLPIGGILPVLLLLIYFSIRRGLKPLDRLAADVSARSPDNLSALEGESAPLEAQPLVRALNRLLSRLDQALEHERRFTADAAHELRTPLAAVKVQTQVALMSPDSQTHAHALHQVEAGVDRCSRLVDQLLRLARLDPLSQLPDLKPVNLVELVRETACAMGSGEQRRAHTITVDAPTQAVFVNGDSDLLAVALRNLLDNALRYAPTGSEITVSVAKENDGPRFAVRDTGPGVQPNELARLAERFYRGEHAQGEGSGLGLAIVRRIATLHGARFEAANAQGGGFVAGIRWG